MPGHAPVPLTAPQARFLAVALRQLHETALRVRDNPLLLFSKVRAIFTRIPEQNAQRKIVWHDEWTKSPVVERSLYNKIKALPDELLAKPGHNIQQTDAVWELTELHLPLPPESVLSNLYTTMFLDAGSGDVLSSHLHQEPVDAETWRITLIGVIDERGERPAAIHIDRDDIMQALEQLCRLLEIELVRTDRLVKLTETEDELRAVLRKAPDQLQVPDARVKEIEAVINRFCAEHLDEDYEELCRSILRRFNYRHHNSIAEDTPEVWAAGILYEPGTVNFLFDVSSPYPHMEAEELCRILGVSREQAETKAASIDELLEIEASIAVEELRRILSDASESIEPKEEETDEPRGITPSTLAALRDDILAKLDEIPLAATINGITYAAHELPEELQLDLFDVDGTLRWIPFECCEERIRRHLPFAMSTRGPLVNHANGTAIQLTPGTRVEIVEAYHEYETPENGIMVTARLPDNPSHRTCIVPICRLEPIDGQPLAKEIRRYQQRKAAGDRWQGEHGDDDFGMVTIMENRRVVTDADSHLL